MGKIIHLPKLKQDIIKSILGNPKLDGIVENIIKRKQQEFNQHKRDTRFDPFKGTSIEGKD
tara:strand:- start:392 stop:574 length:183 start_codon:yes stop_codon:yes gene_type:complete